MTSLLKREGYKLILKLIAIGSLIYVVIGFINPDFIINTWPWTLSTLTARVMCGWIALLGVGAFTMSTKKRWSGWKTSLVSIAIWHILVFVVAFMNPSDFKTGLVNWHTLAIGDVGRDIYFLSDDGNEKKGCEISP